MAPGSDEARPAGRVPRLRSWPRRDRLVLGIAVAALVAAGIIRWLLLVQPIGGDPALYAYVGSRILDGAVPYRDVFEQKPPGILYTYALAFGLLGRSIRTVQLLDAAAWLALLGLVPALCHALWRDRTATICSLALAAAFIHPTLQSGFKQVAQAETFIAVWAVGAMLLTLLATDAGRAGPRAGRTASAAALAAGVFSGLAFLYKYNAGTYLVACLAAAYLRSPDRRLRLRVMGAIGLGFLLPVVGLLAWFGAKGAVGELYEATVLYNLAYSGGTYDTFWAFGARAAQMSYRFATMNFLWIVGGFGAIVALVRAAQGDARGLPVLFLVAAAYLTILINAKFYPQYFLQILAPWAVAGGYFFSHLLGWGRRRPLFLAAALLLLGFEIRRHTPFDRLFDEARAAWAFRTGGLAEEVYFERFGGYGNGGDFSFLADVRLARMIRETTREDETVYLYGGEALVLFLADRPSASRFVWNDPWLAGAYTGRYTSTDLIEELRRARPAYFIVLKNDANLIDPVDSLQHFEADSDLQQYVSSEYQEVGWMEDFLVFRHRTPLPQDLERLARP